ncbi:hypothetical protein QUF80_21105 [Desulfococcaceae bacterium HSG8]|nr:hypothetical protein [Desulfococcaceae bacterium HSG8]
MSLRDMISNIKYEDDLQQAKEKAVKRIKLAMDITGYTRNYFIREDSEFQQTISIHMKKQRGYSESAVKKFLNGDFGNDTKREKCIRFLEAAMTYFNLQNDTEYLFDEKADKKFDEEFSNIVHERWRERNKAYEKLLTRMDSPGELFKKKLNSAKKISLSSISLHNMLTNYKEEIEISLKNGGRLRLIIINPNSTAIHECSFRSSKRWAEKRYVDEVEKTLRIIRQWMDLKRGFKVGVRFINHLPSYAITIIEPNSLNEKIHCHARFFPFRSSSLKGPSINPDSVIHKEWFDFFCEQYEELWNAATNWEPIRNR